MTATRSPDLTANLIERGPAHVLLRGQDACADASAEIVWEPRLSVRFRGHPFPHLDLRRGVTPSHRASQWDVFRRYVRAIERQDPSRDPTSRLAFRREVAAEKARFLDALPRDLLNLGRRFRASSRHEVVRIGTQFPGPFTLNAMAASPGVVILAAAARERALYPLADDLGEALAKGRQPRRFLLDAWPQVLQYLYKACAQEPRIGWPSLAVHWMYETPATWTEAGQRFRRWVLGAGPRVAPDHLFDLPPSWVGSPATPLRSAQNAKWYRIMSAPVLRVPRPDLAKEVAAITRAMWLRPGRMLIREPWTTAATRGEALLDGGLLLSSQDPASTVLAARVRTLQDALEGDVHDGDDSTTDAMLDALLPVPWPDVNEPGLVIRFLRTRRAIDQEGRTMQHCLRHDGARVEMEAFAAAIVDGESLTLKVCRDLAGVPGIAELRGTQNAAPSPVAKRRLEEAVRGLERVEEAPF